MYLSRVNDVNVELFVVYSPIYSPHAGIMLIAKHYVIIRSAISVFQYLCRNMLYITRKNVKNSILSFTLRAIGGLVFM